MTVEDLALEIIEELSIHCVPPPSSNEEPFIMIGEIELDSKHGVIELIKMLKKLDGEP